MKVDEVIIRKAKRNDINRVYLFEREYMIEYEPEHLDRWDSVKDKTMKLLSGSIDRMYVATVGDKLVGHSYWNIYKEEPCVYSIYVTEDFRRKGIANKLINSIEKQVTDSGYNKVTLSTLVTNQAQYLFNKMGYEVVDIKDGYINYNKVYNL
ncbi:GNAT family N-acetyltransferase [Clostridiaceae bacterium M8S5]|nr:GNAT family N-acetyltransferase [Clostridiaceae bacterium M8S5]